ncbi:MAG: AraC family transcriptional regulator [Treponema sp.]|nr:AraC family transcriptional regulator [Treponema sp.]
MEIVYIKKGNGTISVNLTDYEVSAGSFVIILPGQLHSISTQNLTRMEYENIIFSTDLLQSKLFDISETEFLMPFFAGNISVPIHFYKGVPHYEELIAILDNCDRIGTEKPEGSELLIKAQLLTIIFILINKCKLSSSPIVQPKKLDRMKTALKYIELHYNEKITIDEIAKETGCAPSYFMKTFKQNLGVPFIEYLNDYRLIMSARLLTETSKSIMEISYLVGYENLSYFNRSFKKKYKISPGKFRKQ